MVELIITEKPAAAKKIADALADGKAIKEADKGVPYYKVTHGTQDILVASAVGHLYGLAEKEKTKGFQYPVFDIHWVPTSEQSKGAAFTKKYLDVIKKLSREATTFTVATDYDVEGEVIGLNVIRFVCKQKDARRMKFSTLTTDELRKAYTSATPTLDWGQAEAGETRHFLDFYYGINLSRALTSAIKTAGMFKILSTGRVQGPGLNIIVEREKEIQAFTPVPYWQLSFDGAAKGKPIEGWHTTDKFWEEKTASEIHKKIVGEKKGMVKELEKSQFAQKAPHPFDLTTLQTEAYRVFGISPKHTLSIAQELYTAGLISYPRTSSQQLPAALGLKGIVQQLAKQTNYAALCAKTLKTSLQPNDGKKTDPAHPAIFPTGNAPSSFQDPRYAKIYDLVVKRFLATFGRDAMRETMTATVMLKDEQFVCRGTRTIELGWHEFYAPYVKLEEVELPPMTKGEAVDVKKVHLHAKETQPPKRFTEASIIKELERRNLGTKATRAQIIDTLYDRNYVKGKQIEATELGMHIIEVLQENAPKILDEALTRHFEKEMDRIRERKLKGEKVLDEARKVLVELLSDFKGNEKKIGEGLKTTFTETREVMNTVGKCPVCSDGMLGIRKGKFGKFVACDKYPECKTTFKLPTNGLVEVSDKVCEHCQHPIITIIKQGKRPREICINKECPSKHENDEELNGLEGKSCPQCKEGKLVIRRSIYGSFIACNKFPKCKYIAKTKKTFAKKERQVLPVAQENKGEREEAADLIVEKKEKKARARKTAKEKITEKKEPVKKEAAKKEKETPKRAAVKKERKKKTSES